MWTVVLGLVIVAIGTCLVVQGLHLKRLYGALLVETEHHLDELRCLVKLEQHWAEHRPAPDEEPTDEMHPKLVN